MAQPQNPGAWHPPPASGGRDHKGNGWPIAACCVPMMAGAVALMLVDRASVVFLVLFTACTALVALLMAGIG